MEPSSRIAGVQVRALSSDEALAVTAWRYEAPWSVYDGRIDELISSDKGYQAIVEQGTDRFLGFICSGEDARVPGLTEEEGVLDVGVGLDPAIVGKGNGRLVVGSALDALARGTDACQLRTVVQAWNERSLRLCHGLGFEDAGHLVVGHDGGSVDYVVLRKTLRKTG